MPANAMDFEKYTQTLQQTMEAAIRESEKLAAIALIERETAADLQVSRQAKLNQLDNQGRAAADAYMARHHRQMQDAIQKEIRTKVIMKLLASGHTSATIAHLLDVEEDFIIQLQNG